MIGVGRPPMARRCLAALIFIRLSCSSALAGDTGEWPYTEGAAGGGRYSPLADINRGNVASLRVAWTYRHGDFYDGGIFPDSVNRGTAFEGTPLMVDNRLIFTTPYNQIGRASCREGV